MRSYMYDKQLDRDSSSIYMGLSTEVEGYPVRVSPVALRCVLEQDTFPSA